MKKLIQILCVTVMLCLLVSCSGEKDDSVEQGESIENSESITLTIAEIKDEYFLAQPPLPSPLQYKVFANLDEDYSVGDYVEVYYEEMTEIEEDFFEITALQVEHSDFELEEGVDYKPVIYLYPEDKQKVFVSLDYNGTLTHSYPIYSNGWTVTAYPNGTLVDNKGNEYPYLFWEGESNIVYDMSKGFCISGDQTEQFLREKLSFMGLNENELNDFVEFWIPFMEKNSYNKICFQTTDYTDNAKLTVNPEPDSILRIYMVFQPLEEFIDIEEQLLMRFERTGFTLVEWGGSIIK